MIVDYRGFVFNSYNFSHLSQSVCRTRIKLYANMKQKDKVLIYDSGNIWNRQDAHYVNCLTRLAEIKRDFTKSITPTKNP